jgi:hypothetical protein
MRAWTHIGRLGALAGSLLVTASTATASPVLTLHVKNVCKVPLQTLTEAEAVATDVYRAINVQVRWTHKDGDVEPQRLTVMLLSAAEERQLLARGASLDMLGVAPPGTGRVYIWCSRISNVVRHLNIGQTWMLATAADRGMGVVLGRIIAHEVGHQLLPNRGHSQSGIMREMIEYRLRTSPTFTLDEAESIRTFLSEDAGNRSAAATAMAH